MISQFYYNFIIIIHFGMSTFVGAELPDGTDLFDRDLVLLDESSHAGHFGNAVDSG